MFFKKPQRQKPGKDFYKSAVYVMSMIRVLFITSLALVASPGAATAQSVVHGFGQSKDGDSLLVGSTEVRLYGIDAPEWGQSCTRGGQSWDCGAAASNALAKLVSGRSVMCWSMGVDDFGRTLARCTSNGVDVNQRMVAQGHAVAFRKYASDYVAAEEQAKAAKLGLWSGDFQRPEEFRRIASATSKPRASERRPAPGKARSSDWAGRAASNCNIKGNRNRKGQWIYHVPGMPYYDQTRPEEIFCTEAEARQAGYRRAIVR